MRNILKIIFAIVILIFLPLGEIARLDIKENIALVGLDILVGLFFVLFIVRTLIQRRKDSGQTRMTKKSLLKPISYFVYACILSLLVNSFVLKTNALLIASLYLVRWISYVGIYFFVAQSEQRFKGRISLLLFISGVLIILIGYLQIFFYPNLRNLAYLGWDVHLYRMFGSFLDPNFLGAFLVLYFLFIISLFLQKLKQWKEKKENFKSIGFIFLIISNLLAIFLTYSRSAYLMLFIGMITFLGFKKLSKRILFLSLGIIFLCLSLVTMLTRYSEGTNLLRITSTKARITTSENALIVFQKNPLFGVGFNAYRYAQERYHFIDETKNLVSIDHGSAGTDNSFLFVLATTGIVGFILYCYLWFIILKENKNSLIIASSVALFVGSFFINSLFYPFIMLWMWVIIGLNNTSQKKRDSTIHLE